MNRTDRTLSWAYLLAGVLAMHCAANSARNGAPWYAAGLAATSVLLVVALVREHLAADERRETAVQAERAARLRVHQDDVLVDWDRWLCCVPGFTSRGKEHDAAHCTRKDQAA